MNDMITLNTLADSNIIIALESTLDDEVEVMLGKIVRETFNGISTYYFKTIVTPDSLVNEMKEMGLSETDDEYLNNHFWEIKPTLIVMNDCFYYITLLDSNTQMRFEIVAPFAKALSIVNC